MIEENVKLLLKKVSKNNQIEENVKKPQNKNLTKKIENKPQKSAGAPIEQQPKKLIAIGERLKWGNMIP